MRKREDGKQHLEVSDREFANAITTVSKDSMVATQKPEEELILKIKNATKKGYLEARDGDGVDISSRMEAHRGTVQRGKCQTLQTNCGNDNGVVVEQEESLRQEYARLAIERDDVGGGDD